jgi:CO/xanthine dehydrogenase Mo-binding subunit
VAGIGARVRRIEDPPLLRGAGRFAADISMPGQLHMRVVRASVASGFLRNIDFSQALAAPGVVAVWTGADVEKIPPISFRLLPDERLLRYRQHILCRDRVRYVGEPIAVVFAEDPYLAEDAADLVFADIDAIDPILDPTAPPGWFAEGVSSEAAVIEKSIGDVEAAFARAAHIVSLDLAVGRHSGVPLETRGALAWFNAEKDRLEMYGAAKVPHFNRLAIAAMLDLAPERIHLFEGHVGGGFGIRGELYPEDVLVCLAALRLGQPVKWIEDRREHLMAANHSRDQVHRIRAAVDERGFVLGVDDEFWLDQGGYVRTHAITVPDLTASMLPGPYCFPAYRSRGHVRLTNKTPCGTYRAPGRYEGTFVRERLMDAVALRVGIDPIEVRQRNLIPADAMPFRRGFSALGTEIIYDSGDFAGLLEKLADRLDYPALQLELAERRRCGEWVGGGLAYFVEKSGLGPFDDVRISLSSSGVEIVTGVASIGQGVETAMAQICADVLGVPHEGITVIHGQTDRIARGMGAFASRVTVMTGSAVAMAAAELRERLLVRGAELLQCAPDDLTIAEGRIMSPLGASLAIGEAGPMSADATYETAHMTYPYGIHFAVVGVDRETFGVSLERFVVAYDIGRAVNPMLVEGQIAGGAAQGIGGALLEQFCYSSDGQPLSASLADYLMPTLAEIPTIEFLLTEDAPNPAGPLGVKGAGEGGITAAGAAIAAAVDAAIGRPGAIDRLPITPTGLYEILRGG